MCAALPIYQKLSNCAKKGFGKCAICATGLHCLQGQKPGDYVLFRVEIDCVAVMSACPHDLAPYINGEGGPRDVHYQIYETA